jgi:nitrite reductase/ring-hydroxylating ferredoxin subunit
MREVLAGTVDEFDEDVRIIVAAGTREIGVFRVGGRYYAFLNRCLHQGGPVCEGTVIGKVEAVLDDGKRELGRRFSTEKRHLVCPWHAWEFDIETGECAGDQTMKLHGFLVRVEGNRVFVSVG